MKSTAEKLRAARTRIGFSQEYVAGYIGLPRSAITQIELGNRKVTTDELVAFCQLYQVSADYLVNSEATETSDLVIFARGFDGLSESDKKEILNLIDFKRAISKL